MTFSFLQGLSEAFSNIHYHSETTRGIQHISKQFYSIQKQPVPTMDIQGLSVCSRNIQLPSSAFINIHSHSVNFSNPAQPLQRNKTAKIAHLFSHLVLFFGWHCCWHSSPCLLQLQSALVAHLALQAQNSACLLVAGSSPAFTSSKENRIRVN